MRALIASAAVAAWLACAGVATAHVEVLPTSVPAGEAVEFIVRVPTERDLPTTRVRVDFPPQVTAAPPGRPVPRRRLQRGVDPGRPLR